MLRTPVGKRKQKLIKRCINKASEAMSLSEQQAQTRFALGCESAGGFCRK